MTSKAKTSKWLDLQIGDLIWIRGDKRRTGLIIKEDRFTPMFLVHFFDPIFSREAWFHEDMIIRLDDVSSW